MAILFVLEFHDPEAGLVQHLYRQRLSRECVAGPFLLMLGEVERREREVCVDTQVHRPASCRCSGSKKAWHRASPKKVNSTCKHALVHGAVVLLP